MQTPPLRFTALASAGLLTLLCAITLLTGASQQSLEWAQPPEAYAAALLAHASALRVLIAIDDVFIAAYVATSVLFASELARRTEPSPLLVLAGLGGTMAGVLDLEENHHLLVLLTLAEHGVVLPLEEILHRSDLSQVKWMLGHLSFALLGLAIRGQGWTIRAFQLSLIAVQLPLGAAVWALDAPPLLPYLVWARYGALLAGFVFLALMAGAKAARVRAAADEPATGAPA